MKVKKIWGLGIVLVFNLLWIGTTAADEAVISELFTDISTQTNTLASIANILLPKDINAILDQQHEQKASKAEENQERIVKNTSTYLVKKPNRAVAKVKKPQEIQKPKLVVKGERVKIGITEFRSLNEEAKKDNLGEIISEVLTISFVSSQAFKIIERDQLRKIIKELKLSESGIIDSSYAKEIGKIAGADAIVTGSVIKIGNDLRLNARIIDVESGIILTAEKSEGKLNIKSLGMMADRIVEKLVKKFYMPEATSNGKVASSAIEPSTVQPSPTPTPVSEKGRLYVITEQENASIRILNIVPPYTDGILLSPGNYQVEISAHGYKQKQIWVALRAGEEKRVTINLEREVETQKIPSAPTEVLKLDSPITLAIFPWKHEGAADYWKWVVIESLKELLTDTELFEPIYSYYDLGIRIKTRKLTNKNMIVSNNINVINKIWFKKSFMADLEPRIDLVCEIGKQLQVDAVLIYHIEVHPADPPNGSISIFLINVKTGKMYHARDQVSCFDDDGYKMSKDITKKIFSHFIKDK